VTRKRCSITARFSTVVYQGVGRGTRPTPFCSLKTASAIFALACIPGMRHADLDARRKHA